MVTVTEIQLMVPVTDFYGKFYSVSFLYHKDLFFKGFFAVKIFALTAG